MLPFYPAWCALNHLKAWPLSSLFAAACCRSGSTKATDVTLALCAAGAERPTSADSDCTLHGESGDQVPCTSAHGKNTSGGSQKNQKTMGDVDGDGYASLNYS